jgi:hypothetical protein
MAQIREKMCYIAANDCFGNRSGWPGWMGKIVVVSPQPASPFLLGLGKRKEKHEGD